MWHMLHCTPQLVLVQTYVAWKMLEELACMRRPLQREVINATLQGRDVLCLMPTGP